MKTAPSCPHEADVLELATLGNWPLRAEPALRAHVADCAVCADLALVAPVVADWRDSSMAHVRVPDASVVWRRAERRARSNAARRAARPVFAVEMAAAAAILLLGVAWGPGLAVLSSPASWLGEWALSPWQAVSGLWSLIGTLWTGLISQTSATSTVRWTILALAAWAVLIPVALSLATLADRVPRRENGPSGPLH